MKKLCIMLAIIMVLTSAFTGCVKKDSEETTKDVETVETKKTDDNDKPVTKEPTTLTVSLEGEPDHLDNQAWQAALVQWATDPINGFLVSYDENLNIVPDIAESWEFTSENTFKFVLRKNVYFHNGRQVKAEDVKYSFDRVMNETTGSRLRTSLNVVESVEVLNDYEGVFNLKFPFAPLLDQLTFMAIVPKEASDNMKTNPVGCGPFKFKDWKRDQYLELEKFDKYWKAGSPKVDRLIFKFYPEYSAARSSFLAKDLDILLWLKNIDVQAMKDRKDAYVVGKNLLGYYYVGFNCQQAPYNDVRVRKAIKYAVDKEACLKSALSGFGDTADVTIDKNSFFYDKSFEYQRDIEKAKKLLAEAGYPNGFKDKIIVPLTPTEGPLGELMQFQLKEIGIELEVEKLEVASYVERIFTNKDFNVTVCGYTGAGDPDNLCYNYYTTTGKSNIFKYSNPTFDELMESARSTYDKNKRKEYYKEAFTILLEDAPTTHLVREMRNSAVQDYVKGFIFKPNLRYDFSEVTVD